MKHKLESRLLGEIPITSDTQVTHRYGRLWKTTKEPLDESERGEWKSWLKTQHFRKWRSWHLVPSLQANREAMGKVRDFILGGSKITADSEWSHEIKRHLLPGRKAMTNLDSILKNRDITLLTKVHPVRTMVFPVVVYGCETWTIKKAEHQRMDAFELWCWRRLWESLGIQGGPTSPS